MDTVHPVRLNAFWISETPLSWAAYASLMGWSPPPNGLPPQEPASEPKQSGLLKRISQVFIKPTKPEPVAREMMFRINAGNRIRLQYCEDGTTGARNWHAHAPEQQWTRGGIPISSREIFGTPPRIDPTQPWTYNDKPMVAVSLVDAEALCQKISNPKITYTLPTEAQWEKAARGGLIGCRYPWDNQTPLPTTSDFGRFDQFSILPMHRFPPNGYGLFAVSGCVWEWTADWYDAQYYASSPGKNPSGPESGQEKIIRGGSWTDCAEVTTVSFRMSIAVNGDNSGGGTPNIGFRICRTIPTSLEL